jgi:hypothetical protein
MATICVDFDGTVVTHDYPRVGKDIGAVPVLKRLVEDGHRLILWTMRDKAELQDAVNWFFQNNIPLWGVNENPEQHTWTDSPKAYGQHYIDDCAVGTPLIHGVHSRPYIDWARMEQLLLEMGVL